jgi:ABC-type uncharacterized transport system, ATPase component
LNRGEDKLSFIDVQGLSKQYKVLKRVNEKRDKSVFQLFRHEYENVDAIKDLSFTIDKQDIVGYIGPNGSGKSTTIKLLSGILKPDSGTCVVDGEVPWKNRKKYVKNIGVMFGQRSQLLWDLPPLDSFELLKGIYKLSDKEYLEVLTMLVDLLNLSEFINKPVRQLSLGQRIRCELAATFIHSPKLVFLDEPTIGIDIEVKKSFHEFIKTINKSMKVTIFITTHDLDDIETLCNKLMIINKGELYFNNTINQLYSNNVVLDKIFVELADSEQLKLPVGATLVKRENNKAVVDVVDSNIVGRVINDIARNNNILNIYVQKPQIEDIILKIYKSFKNNQPN